MNTETNQKEAYIAPNITIVDVVYESIICGTGTQPPYDQESGDYHGD